MSDANLYAIPYKEPLFKEKIEKVASNGKTTYFVIRGIDELEKENQNRYIGLVKDREFHGYFLPSNVLVVFTVKTKENLKNISPELYHFCVVAF